MVWEWCECEHTAVIVSEHRRLKYHSLYPVPISKNFWSLVYHSYWSPRPHYQAVPTGFTYVCIIVKLYLVPRLRVYALGVWVGILLRN